MRTVLTDRGSYSVSYRPNPDPIPLSQEFALDITIKDIDGNQIFDNISIEATADMPAAGQLPTKNDCWQPYSQSAGN